VPPVTNAVPRDTAPRGDVRPPDVTADEKTTLLVFLNYLRDAVAAKLAGLSEEDARRRLVPSETSLLWLAKHLTAVERGWFLYAYAGRRIARPDQHVNEADTVGSVLAAYRAAVEESDEVVAECPDLEQPGVRSLRETAPPTMRWVLLHMIEETARHAGHADILREQIDGAVGR
jgi:uncharacterized damage-inducible protein DinB